MFPRENRERVAPPWTMSDLILPPSHRRRPEPLREFGIYVTPEELFTGEPVDENALVQLLGEMGRDAVLFACARLNAIVSGIGHPDQKPRQERAIRLTCTDADIYRINQLPQKYPGSGLPTLFFRGQLLELMRWAIRYCPDNGDAPEILNDPKVRSRFLRAALIASNLWSRRVFSDRLRGEQDINAARVRALGVFRRALEESAITPHIGTVLGRGWSMFSEYFPRHYPVFAQAFPQATGLSLEQYFTCLTGIAATYLPFDREDAPQFQPETVAASTAYREIFPKYLMLESQTLEQAAIALWDDFAEVGYRGLRERPIVRLKNGNALILDPVFYCERISVGPLFHLSASVRGNRSKSIEVFSAFGKAFEDYSADLLRSMYPSRPPLVSRFVAPIDGQDVTGKNFEIDAVLNDAVEVIIFEAKAAWLKDEVVLGDAEEWLEQIRSRYGVRASSTDETQSRPKGVAQLAKIVRRFLDDNLGSAQLEFQQARVIYPVLLVHDTRLNAPIYGNFLANEFLSLLGKVPESRHVMPLIVMTIQDLENLQSSIGGFALRDLFADYAKACPDGMRSLHNFMTTSPTYLNKLRPSDHLIKNSEQLMRHAYKELFPDSSMPAAFDVKQGGVETALNLS